MSSITLLALSAGPVLAVAPGNDNFANATVVTLLPFAETTDASGATSESGEPFPSCIAFQGGTAWYSFTPATNVFVQATAMKNGFLFATGAYIGASLGTLQEVTCGVGGVSFQASAGTTYHIQVLVGGVYDFSLGVTAPPAKPDARIRHLGGSLLGNDLYNSDGAFQTLFPKVPAGRSRQLVISIQNDSTGPDSFTVVASGTAANGFAARYYDRWPPIDVTSEIEAGTFTTPTLQPGAIYRIRVVVDVGLDAGIGEDAGLKRLVTVASTGQPSKLDAVGLLVTRRPGPV